MKFSTGHWWKYFQSSFTDKFFPFAFCVCQIGNWSRWLTDLFGMDDDDSHDDKDDNDRRHDSSFKPFHLLYSLSDLLMLPKDMLLSESVRKEVCQ